MGFCKENENGICKPDICKSICPIGNELKQSAIFKKCKTNCTWTTQGINEINTCKDPYCPIGDTIVSFRKK